MHTAPRDLLQVREEGPGQKARRMGLFGRCVGAEFNSAETEESRGRSPGLLSFFVQTGITALLIRTSLSFDPKLLNKAAVIGGVKSHIPPAARLLLLSIPAPHADGVPILLVGEVPQVAPRGGNGRPGGALGRPHRAVHVTPPVDRLAHCILRVEHCKRLQRALAVPAARAHAAAAAAAADAHAATAEAAASEGLCGLGA